MADLYNNTDLLRQAISALAEKTAGSGGIDGSGVSGHIAVFNGEKSITSGPAINVGDAEKFLRGDGEWSAIPTAKHNQLGLVKTIDAETSTQGYIACRIVQGVVYHRSYQSQIDALESRIACLEDLNGCSV